MTNENTALETETETENTAATPVLKNDKRMSDLMKQVGKLGEEASLGRDSLPKLAHAVVKAAADGVITGADAEGIYKKYADGESKKALHEHSASGKKANISKLKQLIDMGSMATIDAVTVMQEAYTARENMVKDSHKVKSAYPFYVDVARAQQKTDKALDLGTLEELSVKPDANPKSLETVLKGILKKLEDLVSGEGREALKDDHENTEAAYHLIKDRLDAMATLRQQNELRQKAALLGMKLS